MASLEYDAMFLLTLAVKMTAAAAVVVAATVIAQRFGPLIGSLIATLPVSTGPAYVLLAFDHPDSFIAESALSSVAINLATVFLSVVYALLAQRHSLLISMTASLAAWFAGAILVNSIAWTLPLALAANAIVCPIGIYLLRDLRNAPMPQVTPHWTDIATRAVGVALLIAAVVTLSAVIGPHATGILAVFPSTFISIMFILYRRAGGPAAAAVLANGMFGLIGFMFAMMTIHLAAIPLGTPLALLVAFAVSIAWNLMLYFVNKHYAKSKKAHPA